MTISTAYRNMTLDNLSPITFQKTSVLTVKCTSQKHVVKSKKRMRWEVLYTAQD